MSEEWKPVYDGFYEVSNRGRVKRVRPRFDCVKGNRRINRLIKPQKLPAGYLLVTLCVMGVHHQLLLHRLVAAAFLKPVPDGMQVNHKNGLKHDNRSVNLEYLSAQDNCIHASRTGLTSIGEDHYRAKLTERDVRSIRKEYVYGSGVRMAGQYGVTGAMIHRIVRRKNWKHI